MARPGVTFDPAGPLGPIDDYECPICYEVLIESFVAKCPHYVCGPCLRMMGATSGWKCPKCCGDYAATDWHRDVRGEEIVAQWPVACNGCARRMTYRESQRHVCAPAKEKEVKVVCLPEELSTPHPGAPHAPGITLPAGTPVTVQPEPSVYRREEELRMVGIDRTHNVELDPIISPMDFIEQRLCKDMKWLREPLEIYTVDDIEVLLARVMAEPGTEVYSNPEAPGIVQVVGRRNSEPQPRVATFVSREAMDRMEREANRAPGTEFTGS